MKVNSIYWLSIIKFSLSEIGNHLNSNKNFMYNIIMIKLIYSLLTVFIYNQGVNATTVKNPILSKNKNEMKNKILIVVTNHGSYGKKSRSTGLWMGEFVHVYEQFITAGYICDIVSPTGSKIPIDPESSKGYAIDKSIKSFYNNPEKMKLLENTMASHQINPKEYNCIFYTGEHGTM